MTVLSPRFPHALPDRRPLALRLWDDAPEFAGTALFLALCILPVALAAALDPRDWLGEAIWLKPLKFLVSLSVYLATLAAFARWLPAGMATDRRWRAYAAAVCLAVLAEVAWIGGAAAMGTGSHFNTSTPLWNLVYGLMGFLAAFLTSASLAMAVLIHRNPATGMDPALKLSVVLGLGLTLPLTLVVAFTMAAGTGHLVGVPLTDARLPVMGWSREVGDLRVPHFIATHALHAVPLAGWIAARHLPPRGATVAVVLAAGFWVALTFATFAQALAGQPFL
ncbi:MAG: hypothetical protein RIR62_3375 [Pseudomonadota bacterium]|jgi:hypothetical protein